MAESEGKAAFERDPKHWLEKLSPEEWIQSALTELRRAQDAFAGRNVAAAYAGLKRAAGMALNGALIVAPRQSWGRTYVEHLQGLAESSDAPEPVRAAARAIFELKAPAGQIVSLRTQSDEERLLEATKTVMAHAYAIVHGNVGGGDAG